MREEIIGEDTIPSKIVREAFSERKVTTNPMVKTVLKKYFKYYCDEVSPFIFVGLCLLYIFVRNWSFVPHVIVIGTLLLVVTLIINVYRQCHDLGFINSIYNFFKAFLSKSWVRIVLTYEDIKTTWLGKTLTIGGLINLVFLSAHWAWYNFPLITIVANSVVLAKAFLTLFTNPKGILDAFDNWLQTIPALKYCIYAMDKYVTTAITKNEEKRFENIFAILFVTFVLLFFAILNYVLFTFVLRKKYCCKRTSQN